jgi:aerobic-type carbon monoxide dehydrogenase small subunit (CoxS/CutS family)
MVLAAAALLRRNARPDAVETAEALAGVLCRCGTYPKVLEAIRAMAGPEVDP